MATCRKKAEGGRIVGVVARDDSAHVVGAVTTENLRFPNAAPIVAEGKAEKYVLGFVPKKVKPKKPRKPAVTSSEFLLQLTDANFGQTVSGAEKVVLVCFTTSWCTPCKQIMSSLMSIATEFGKAAIVAEVATTTAPEAIASCKVVSVPTVIAFLEGKEIFRQVGANTSVSKLRSMIKKAPETCRMMGMEPVLADPEPQIEWISLADPTPEPEPERLEDL